ncbi:MAG: winged helix-turn-helix domain-containing protein [Beijerinckiaceae bacterium]
MTGPRVTIRLDFAEGRQLGHGKIRLLELIGEHGSISSAARAMKMSYRRAWLLTDEVNSMFSEPVVETQLGGKGGGRAGLTEFGQQVVKLYRAIENDAAGRFSGDIGAIGAKLRKAEG